MTPTRPDLKTGEWAVTRAGLSTGRDPEGAMDGETKAWTFLTNHARVMIAIASDPHIRTRDIADRIGITDRAIQRIVAELETAGYLSHDKIGRRNRYIVHADAPLRHPLERNVEVHQLIDLLVESAQDD